MSSQPTNGIETAPTAGKSTSIPDYWKIILSVVATVASTGVILAGLGVWYLKATVDMATTRTDADLRVTVRDLLDPVKRQQDQMRLVLSLIVKRGGNFTDAEREVYNSFLNQVHYEGLKELESPQQAAALDLDTLRRDGKVRELSEDRKLKWNKGSDAQVRYFQSTDPSRDYRNVDFYTRGNDAKREQGCSTRNLDLPEAPNLVIKVCISEQHLDEHRKLELIVVRPADGETDTTDSTPQGP